MLQNNLREQLTSNELVLSLLDVFWLWGWKWCCHRKQRICKCNYSNESRSIQRPFPCSKFQTGCGWTISWSQSAGHVFWHDVYLRLIWFRSRQVLLLDLTDQLTSPTEPLITIGKKPLPLFSDNETLISIFRRKCVLTGCIIDTKYLFVFLIRILFESFKLGKTTYRSLSHWPISYEIKQKYYKSLYWGKSAW